MAQDFPLSSEQIVNDILRDTDTQDTLAVNAARGNNLRERNELFDDLEGMSYGQIANKYGADVARNRFRLQNGTNRLLDSDQDSRTIGEAISDSFVGAATALGRVSTTALGAGAGYIAGALDGDPNTSGRGEAAATVDAWNDIWSGVSEENLSETLQEKQRFSAIEGVLDAQDSEAQFKEEVESGSDPFAAALRRVGRDAFNAGERTLRDGALATQVVSEGVGSLIPSAIIAGATGGLGAGAATALGGGTRAAQVAQYTGSAIGIGAVEASGTYAESVSTILDLPEEELMNSSLYQSLLEEYNGDTARARVELAGLTGEQAFVTNLPASIALGALTAKFEAMPIRSFRGAGVAGGMRNVISQGIEEAGQGAISQVVQNYTQSEIDLFDGSLAEGVGEQAAIGAIGGIGQAGVSAAPAATFGTAKTIAEGTKTVLYGTEGTNYSDPVRQAIVGNEGRKGLIQRSSEAASAVADNIDDRREERTQAGRSIREATATVIAEPEATEDVEQALQAVFRGTRRDFKGNAAVFGEQVTKLRQAAASMSGNAREKIMDVLAQPVVQELEGQLNSIDQNDIDEVDIPDVITEDVAEETRSLARVNPAAVNPRIVSKMLEQNTGQISAPEVKTLKAAAKIAQTISDAQETNIEINENENIGLQKIGKPTKSGGSQADTSRSILAAGYTDAAGNNLRSVNDFASDIFAAAQSPTGKIINSRGIEVPASQIMAEFANFVTHMNNKVGALNESLARNNADGRGPLVPFDSLVNGTKFVAAGDPQGSKPVRYNGSNPSSVAFAQRVASDLNVATKVFNDVLGAFPDAFDGFDKIEAVKLEAPTVRETTQETTAEDIQLVDNDDVFDVDQLEVSETVEQEVEAAPRTDDEVSAAADTEESAASQENNSVENLESVQNDDIVETVTDDTPVQIDQSSDTIVDDNNEPIKFYHGTTADFTDFNDGGIFLTTRKGLAREHARRTGEGTPRLIEAEVALGNPLTEQIPDDMDPDEFWLKNSLTLETAKENGGYDSIFIFNNNEGMVIADRNDQVTQTNRDFDGTREQNDARPDEEIVQEDVAQESGVTEIFETNFVEDQGEMPVEDISDFAENTEANPYIARFAGQMVPRWVRKMEARLDSTRTKFGGQDLTAREHAVNGTVDSEGRKFSELREYRNTAIIDPRTGEYNVQLVELAGLVVSDWILNARASMLNQVRDDLMTLNPTKEEFDNLAGSVPSQSAIEEMAAQVRRVWNVKANPDAAMDVTAGIVEGLVGEMLLAAADNGGLIDIRSVPTLVDGEKVYVDGLYVKTDGLKMAQTRLAEEKVKGKPQSVREALFNEKPNGFSLTPFEDTANTQNRSDVRLSATEKKALKAMQDTPHYLNVGLHMLADAMGLDLAVMLGYVDPEDIANETLRNSVEGKNTSIQTDFDDMALVVDALSEDNEAPVYYQVGVTSVGRHQYQGINPQSNKILRAIVAPNWDTIRLDNKEDMDAFWIGVAQAADLHKIEKGNHGEIRAKIEAEFQQEFGEALGLIKEFLRTGELPNGLGAAMGQAEMQQLAAVYAVAEMQFAAENNRTEFRTSLSVELDGLTNGAANMMVNFGQGEISKEEFGNLQRIGLFLGEKGKTINKFFGLKDDGTKEQDLYEKVAERSYTHAREMYKRWSKKKPMKAAQLAAAMRFGERFGNLERDSKGVIKMTRNTAKNPMTKVNYGSGVKGVGVGVADDMLLEFYNKMQNIPTDVKYEDYFGYPEFHQDMKILFGDTLAPGMDGSFEFPQYAVEQFQKAVGGTLGTVLAEATQMTIGNDIKSLNDEMVFMSNFQAAYLELVMQQELENIAPKDPKTGKPLVAKVTNKQFKDIMKKLSPLQPLFKSEDQQLNLGGFSRQQSDLELSSTMPVPRTDANGKKIKTGMFRGKANLPLPKMPGVSAIPYTVIATGDAMMMNLVYSRVADKMPGTLPIFDGIDMPLTKMKEYAPLVNEQVAQTWERDVFGMAMDNFHMFMNNKLDPELAAEAIKKAAEKSPLENPEPSEIMTSMSGRHKAIQARKKVMKRLAKGVDQMGGSDVGFQSDGLELSHGQINEMIRREMAGEPIQEEVKTEVKEFTARALLNRIKGRDEVIKVLKPLISNETRVVFGTKQQLNDYRNENFPDETVSQPMNAEAAYDANNDTIFLTTKNTETALHEMVHAATMGKVLAHYNGEAKHEAVDMIEDLMNEFLSDESAGTEQARAAIIRHQTNSTPEAKAMALNEFMAWGLTNGKAKEALKSKNPILKIAAQVVNLMRKLVGVPTNMFDELVFATGYLGHPPVPPSNNGGDDGSGPFGGRPTGYWIDMVKNWITDQRQRPDQEEAIADAELFHSEADRIISDLAQSNLMRTADARANFKAVYIIMRAGIPANTQMVAGLTKIMNHVMDNIQMPDVRQQQEIENLLDREDGHDSLGIFLALSQSSEQFREAMGEVSPPTGENAKAASLGEFVAQATSYIVNGLTGVVNVEGDLAKTVDNLAKSMHELDMEREYTGMYHATKAFDKADELARGGLKALAGITGRKAQEIEESNAPIAAKAVANTVASVTNLLDADRAELTSNHMQNQMNRNPFFDTVIGRPMRSFVNEVIGMTAENKNLIKLLDEVNYRVVWGRQQIRDRVPALLRNKFTDDKAMAQTMHEQMAKTDLAFIVKQYGAAQALRLITDAAFFNQRLQSAEAAVQAAYQNPNVIVKADQLANFMINGVPGKFLQTNAHAIHMLNGAEVGPDGEALIDEYVTLKAMELAGGDQNLVDYINENEEAAQGLVNWLTFMDTEESQGDVPVSGMARLNHYKGYQPMVSGSGSRIRVDLVGAEASLKLRGWTKVQDIDTDLPTGFRFAYYVNKTPQQTYSQGVMQNAGQTYKGVDKTTGQSTFGADAMEVDVVEALTNFYNSPDSDGETEFYRPVYNVDGTIAGYEFLHNREIMQDSLDLESDVFTLSGIRYGRKFEENAAVEYNKATVEHLANAWKNRPPESSADEYVDIKRSKSPLHREAYRLMPKYIKDYADEQFGEEGEDDAPFMVRKDQVDLAVGYREASVTDFWTGQNTMPKEVNKGARQVFDTLTRGNGLRWLGTSERVLENVVSNVKSTIIVKSVQVAYQNAVSNVWQLANQGVPIKQIIKGTRDKVAELQEFEKLGNQIMDLSVEAELNPSKRPAMERKIKALEARRDKMSIAPMIEAGQFKNLVEGLTEQNEFNKDWEQQLIDLAEKKGGRAGRQAARIAMISKDTKFYKFMNTSTQYGDLVAKSIYYDHLIAQGSSKEEALEMMNENFVNYGILPGRLRSQMERLGGSWFFAYKIKSAKIALRMMRENPVRTLTMQTVGPDVGNPIDDNIFTIGWDRLDFSTGPEMFFTAPEMHPWAVIAGWN